MKKLIVFDAMGVIYKEGDDVGRLLFPYLKRYIPELSYNSLHELYIKLSLGQISSEEFFSALGLSIKYPEIKQDYLDTCLELDTQFIPALKPLSDKYSFAMLSNDVSEWSKYLRKKYDLDRYFSDVIISADVGCRKPSEKIFEILLERNHISAIDCCFIDDNINNIMAAQSLGINTILFDRHAEKKYFGGYKISGFGALAEAIAKIFP
jgi:putative hydrolase of the HAD superfamily